MGPAWEVKISFTGTPLKPPHVLQHVSCVRGATLYAIPPSLCTMFLDMYEQSLAKLVGGVMLLRTGQRQCNCKEHQGRNETYRNSTCGGQVGQFPALQVTPVDLRRSWDTLAHGGAPAACTIMGPSGRAGGPVKNDGSRKKGQAHRGRDYQSSRGSVMMLSKHHLAGDTSGSKIALSLSFSGDRACTFKLSLGNRRLPDTWTRTEHLVCSRAIFQCTNPRSSSRHNGSSHFLEGLRP